MQATKKITRAMELIAASRIVKAQQRVRPPCRTRSRSPKSSRTSPRPARRPTRRCWRVATRSRHVLRGRSPPTAACAAATTPACSARPRARSRPTCSPARTTRSSRSARRPRATSVPRLPARPGLQRLQRPADLRRRPAIGEHVVDLFVSGQVDRVELVYTRFITPAARKSSCVRSCR